MSRSRPLAAVLAAAVSTGACFAAGTARGHDSLAPAGAPHTWLPDEEWLFRHWLPVDERALSARLGLRSGELEAYLYDDHRALADLALARGLDVARLSDELVAPWRASVDDRQYAMLRERTTRLLTQPHLAQHAFFHVFHGGMLAHHPGTTFGLPAETVTQMRIDGLTPIEIAARGGVSSAALRADLLHQFNADREEGIRRGESLPAEGARILARQVAALACWMASPRPGDDPANPYGKARFWHGRHSRGWPGTRRQRRANERRVERFRRSLRRDCWRRPPPWSWTAHGLSLP